MCIDLTEHGIMGKCKARHLFKGEELNGADERVSARTAEHTHNVCSSLYSPLCSIMCSNVSLDFSLSPQVRASVSRSKEVQGCSSVFHAVLERSDSPKLK